MRPAIVVDAANVMGSVPDGWWHDRPGAARRLIARIGALAADGIPAAALDLPEHTWFPEWVVVVEGQARAAGDGAAGVEVVRAEASGDDAIVAEASRLVEAGRTVTVVTSDRELAASGDGCRRRRSRHALAARQLLVSAVVGGRCDAPVNRSVAAAELVDVAALALGRPPGAAVAHRHERALFARQRRGSPVFDGRRRRRRRPTRLEIGCRTTRIRSKPAIRTRSSSPGRTGCAAFARSPFTRTCPARHAVVAAERVL